MDIGSISKNRQKIVLCVFSISIGIPCISFGDSNLGWVGSDLRGKTCTGKRQGIGPFDYTNGAHRNNINYKQVLSSHFPTKVERLQSGNSGSIFAELDYTLRAIPNHHRALYAMLRYQLKKTTNKKETPAECYFQRAILFKPDDIKVRLLYANYLKKTKHINLAIKQYKSALHYQPNQAELHYGIGLLYFKIQQYEQARYHALKAQENGFKRKTLIKKLKAANQWSSS